MAKVTPKENFLKLRHGGMPDYVPFYSLMGDPYLGENAIGGAMDPYFKDTRFMKGGKDMWGVVYDAPANLDATMPDTSRIMLEEIYDWADVIQFPQPEDIDPERTYQEALKCVDRSVSCFKVGPSLSPFQEMAAMMGFEGALIALFTDPEECKAMLNAMVDWIEPYYTKVFEVYKPDFWSMADDTCAKDIPFFSPEIYKDVFLPIYKRLAKPALDNGVPVLFHNCGKEEAFLDFMVEFGVELTEPAQEVNNILALKEKYKGKLTFMGCWGWGDHIPKGYPDFDEEEFRQDIRNTIDKYAPGGGYAFAGFPIGAKGDTAASRAYRIMRDEAHWYGRKVYGYTD
ncbi:MAG: hypothetical protein IJH99_04560 [Eubacterium sp.]|nr:hypothetical protein [Eubacterium sp.]